MNCLTIPYDNIVSKEMIDYNKLVITLKNHYVETKERDNNKLYKISYDVIDDYVYLPKDKNMIITLLEDIYKDDKYILPTPEIVPSVKKENGKMSDYNKYLGEGHIIRCIYKKKIYYGFYSINKRLINNKFRSLSAFVSEISEGRNKNGWGNCEKLRENGEWVKINS